MVCLKLLEEPGLNLMEIFLVEKLWLGNFYMDSISLRKNSKLNLKFSFYLIHLDIVLNFLKLLKMLKLNTFWLKNYHGAFGISFPIILFIGKALMDHNYLVIFHLLILIVEMDQLKRFLIMLKISKIKEGLIVH